MIRNAPKISAFRVLHGSMAKEGRSFLDVLLVAGGERWSINQNFSYQKSFAKRKDQYGAAVKADDMGPLILPFSGVLFCMQLKNY